MDKMDYMEFMGKNEFKVEGKLAYGNMEGYPLLIRKKLGSKIEITFYLEGEPWKQVREKLLEYAKLFKSSVYFENQHVVWNTHLGKREYTRFQEMIQGIIRIFRATGIEPPGECVICGEKHADSFAVIDGGNHPIHRECLQKQLTVTRQRVSSGSYLFGVLGSILGCLVGCIPCILSLNMVGKTFCVLFLFIPPCIYYGCKLLKGKMNHFVFWMSVFLSFVSVYVIELAVRVQYNLVQQNLPFEWYYITHVLEKLMTYDGIWWMITKQAGLNFVFALMGILINWELISQTSLKAEENVVKVINTINYENDH